MIIIFYLSIYFIINRACDIETSVNTIPNKSSPQRPNLCEININTEGHQQRKQQISSEELLLSEDIIFDDDSNTTEINTIQSSSSTDLP